MEDKEEWRPIIGLEGMYEVSNLGNIRGLDRYVESMSRWGTSYQKFCKGQLIKPVKMPNGYLQVSLGGKRETYVHILVAEVFVDNPDNKSEVHHINHIRDDDRAINLRWVTRAEQSDEHRSRLISIARTGQPSKLKGIPLSEEQKSRMSNTRIKKGISKGIKNPRATPVDQYDIKGNFIASFDYIGLARGLGTPSQIGQVCRGKRLQTGGYVWRFKGEPFDKYRTPKRIKLR